MLDTFNKLSIHCCVGFHLVLAYLHLHHLSHRGAGYHLDLPYVLGPDAQFDHSLLHLDAGGIDHEAGRASGGDGAHAVEAHHAGALSHLWPVVPDVDLFADLLTMPPVFPILNN